MFPKGHGINPTHDPILDSNDPNLDTTASKETALAQFAAEMGVHPESDALLQGCRTKITNQGELEAELNEKAKEAAGKASRQSTNGKLTMDQRGVYLQRKYFGKEWQDSDDDTTYVIDRIVRNKTKRGTKGRMLVAHSKRKSDGKVLHPEGERISYILGKFGLKVTNTGIVVDKEEKEAPTAEVAAEAE